MFRLCDVQTSDQRRRFSALGEPASPSAATIAQERPDALCLLEGPDGPVARCALWWKNTAVLQGRRIGAIGHYFALGDAAGTQLLTMAGDRLSQHGCHLAVGPLDGSIWRRYRMITERGPHRPFFLEPESQDDWLGQFAAAGFEPFARYHSSLVSDLAQEDPQALAAARRLEAIGGVLRPFSAQELDRELQRIHDLSLESFAGSPLFTPLNLDDFRDLYLGLRDHLQSELCWLAEHDGGLIGYVFAIPDLLQGARGERIDAAIVKSLAVHPDHAGIGLGSLLVNQCHQAALRLGYSRAIHALMLDSNYSARISRRTATIFRRYALFARQLDRVTR